MTVGLIGNFEEETYNRFGGCRNVRHPKTKTLLKTIKVYKVNSGRILSYGKLEIGFRAIGGYKGTDSNDMQTRFFGSMSLFKNASRKRLA